MKLCDSLFCNSSLIEILQTDSLALFALCKIALHLTHGPFIDHKHTLALTLLLTFLISQLAFLYLNSIFLCQMQKGIMIIYALFFHYEIDRTATLATRKTFAYITLTIDRKRWCLLVMKWA